MSDLSYVRNNDGTYSKLVQLSGSNVEVTWLNAYAMTTTYYDLPTSIDVSDASEFYFVIVSSLNQSVTLFLQQPNGRGNVGLGIKDDVGTLSIAIADANRPYIFKPSKLPFVKTLKAFISASTAPTSGSVSIYVVKRGKI